MKPAVPAGWIVGVGDVSGTYITRSARHDDVSGKPAVAEYIAKAKDRSGAFYSVNFESLNLLAGYQWSDLSGWLVGANIRQDIVEQPLRRMLTTLGLLTAASLAFSVLLAYTFSQPLLRSINGLASRAAALGKGQPVSELNGRLAEFELVSATIVSAAQSIEEQARQKNLLIAELNHRVKNTLAIVQSLASNTLRGPELAPLKEAFSERLQALAAAHDLLTRESWEGAQLHEIISAVLGPQAGRRFTISGPDVRLDPSQAVRLTMLLHELATNAVKYGALSNDSGRISITSRHGSDELCLCWVESGGPAVSAPNRQGFGSRLLGMATGGFSSTTSYAADGLICKISINLADEPT
jgi:two-component sensor histidine kinase